MEIKAAYFLAIFVFIYLSIGMFVIYFFRKRHTGRFGGQGYKFPAIIYFISVPIIVLIATGGGDINLDLSLDFQFGVGIFLFAVLPTIIYIGIGIYILSLEHIKQRKGYKLPALIYFISVPSIIVIAITLHFFLNYSLGRFENDTKPAGYELYKFLVLQDIIPRSGQSLDEETSTENTKVTKKPTQTVKKVQFNEDILKDKTKLNFKESGPFYGIKENGRMVRGILKGFQNQGFKTDFYGLFTKNQLYWKGYSEIKYDDGRVLYQYNEYKLDENGKVIVDKDGIYQLVDSYLISEDDFAKVRKYIAYDIPIPFDLYDFNENKDQTVKKNSEDSKETNEIKSAKIQNYKNKSYGDIKRDLELEGEPFSLNLGDLKTGEKNISVTIKKIKTNMYGSLIPLGSVAWETKFSYLTKEIKKKDGNTIGSLARTYTITEFEKFPNFKVEKGEIGLGQIHKYTNLPKETKLYQRTKSNNLIIKQTSYGSNQLITYGKDSGYLSWDDHALFAGSSKETTIVEAIGTKQGEIKKIIRGLCKNPNDLFKIMFKEYVNNCDSAFFFASYDTNASLDRISILYKNLQKKLLVSLNSQKTIFTNNEKYYALVIGNNNYEHLEKLDAAENDAEVIADVLTNKYGFEVDLLLNADYEKTVDTLFQITNKLKRNDNLLIYYAGHGELDKAENRGYWLPVDASYEQRSKWISNQRIVDRIKATKAKHVLLIADSCFSGTLMRSGITPEDNEAIDKKYIERLKSKKTRLVITSGGNEPVVDSDGGNHSLFALKLIDTLKNNNTVINSQMLFENIRRYVVSNADQTPERAMIHKTGHDGGDFLFFPKN